MNRSTTRDVNEKKLFLGVCLALLPTAFSFVFVSNILQQLKTEFILTNAQVGYIGGAVLWGMAISLLTIGPFLERIGLKKAAVGAFFGHLIGVTLFIVAYFFAGDPNAFWILFSGAVGMGIGNGLIEVAGNPLTTALFPDNKTTKLNHFHAFYPGGMVFGGVLGWLMVQTGTIGSVDIGHWTLQIAIIYIPIFIYGWMIFPEKFPETETQQAGISPKEMVSYTFKTPLLWGLIFLMMLSLSMEMGPMRWIPEVLQAAGVPGILVLVWISGLMMVLRMFAAPFVKAFSPVGMLVGGAFLTGVGLLMFYFFATGVVVLLMAATVFAAGMAFFFPNMVGIMSERFPKAGSLGIILLIGAGFFAGGGSNVLMGSIADHYLPDALDTEQTLDILEQVEQRFPGYLQALQTTSAAELGYRETDVENVLQHSRQALDYYNTHGELDGNATGNALRALIDSGLEQEQQMIVAANDILRPADNYGGRMSFLYVVPVAFFVAVVFLVVYINDRKKQVTQ